MNFFLVISFNCSNEVIKHDEDDRDLVYRETRVSMVLKLLILVQLLISTLKRLVMNELLEFRRKVSI